jgi:hypothetical protein
VRNMQHTYRSWRSDKRLDDNNGCGKGVRLGVLCNGAQDCTTGLEGPQSAAPATDPNHQWGIRKIIGQKMVGRERHYRVQWKDTWMPESELAGAKKLVDTFTANDGGGTRGRKRPLKRCRPATGQLDTRGGEEPKKRRSRPRKQK